MITDTELERLELLAEAASPGQWGLWVESTPTKEDAIRELVEQVENVPDQDFAGAVFLLDAAGKCPATTGCGPTSRANADFILAVQPSNTLALISSVRELRARAEAAEAENKRLHEMTGVSVTVGGGLQVYGEMDAIRRVQDYIMLDSTHPVEKEDVRRSLVRSLQAAEAENERLRKACDCAIGGCGLIEQGSVSGQCRERICPGCPNYEEPRLDALRAALRYGVGCAINELVSRDLPLEWSPNSGIGTMLAALGCNSLTFDVAARSAIQETPNG